MTYKLVTCDTRYYDELPQTIKGAGDFVKSAQIPSCAALKEGKGLIVVKTCDEDGSIWSIIAIYQIE